MAKSLPLLNGLLIGLALSLGAWLPELLALGLGRVRLVWPVSLLGILLVTLAAMLAAWLAARLEAGWAAIIVWAAAAFLIIQLLGRVPYDGRTFVVWLADSRFRGLPVYPFDEAGAARMWVAAFLVGLFLIVFGLLQSYRLEGVRGALDHGRLSSGAVLRLALPLPLALGAGLSADSIITRPLRTAPQLVGQAIEVARTYDGDLFQLGLQHSRNYAALQGVRGQLSADYALLVAETDLGAAQTVFVAADFDNGAWIYCRVLADQLSHCYDASPPYTTGLAALLTGDDLGDCRACSLRTNEQLNAWLLERGSRFTGPPRLTRLAQWGSHVLMRAADTATQQTVDCLFHGISPVSLVSCTSDPP